MSRRYSAWVFSLSLLAVPLAAGGCGLFGRGKPADPRPLAEVQRDRAAARAESLSPEKPREDAPPREESAEIADRVVAVVNQEAITLMDLLETIQISLQSGQQIRPGEEAKVRAQVLQQLIERRLLVQEAIKEKITVSDDELKEQIDEVMKRNNAKSREEFEENLKAQGLTMEVVRRSLREQRLTQRVHQRRVTSRISVTDQEVDAYLSENRAKLETGLSYHARHIVILPKPEGSEEGWEAARLRTHEVWTKLRAGEGFEQLAREHSEDAAAKDGGDLGSLKRGELAPEFESQILRLSPGEFSEPVRTSVGYQIFKLEMKESLSGEAMAQARQQIRGILQREKSSSRFDAWIEELRKKAIIEIRL